MSDAGYIYIVGWDKFQHYQNRRPTWIKLYVDLLHNDAYLRLSPFSRALLHGLWMLTAERGQGRVYADPSHTLRLLQLPSNRGLRAYEPLIHAGFIEIRDSKALAKSYHQSTESSSKEELRGAASTADAAQPPPDDAAPAPNERLTAAEKNQARRCTELYHSFRRAGDAHDVAIGALEEMFRDPRILHHAIPTPIQEPTA